MSDIIASPFGYGLPYSSLFSVPRKPAGPRRGPNHFWEKASAHPPTPAPAAPEIDLQLTNIDTTSTWLDADTPALSDSEDEGTIRHPQPRLTKKKKSLARIRHIAFRAFIPKEGSHKPTTVVATEIISHQHIQDDTRAKRGPGFIIFNSWRIKSKGMNTQSRKLVAVVRKRISSKSPQDQKPKTWAEYHKAYASEQIDILDPPLPPMDSNTEEPTPFENRFYMPPPPENEQVRQLTVNRLGIFGSKSSYDPSEEAGARARARTELAEQLEQEGKEPTSLDQAWDQQSISSASDMGLQSTRDMVAGVQSGQLPPDTLEQHPVFRKIVKRCREMFGTSISMLTIMDEGRQIFLAESGLGGMRDVERNVTFCAHTILSGRKGFTILDTHKDWRFESGPLVTNFGSRFYCGVPLMAPNLDGGRESDEQACPLGTLCVVDDKPREAFSIEERKKLVYMAEYARREIEKWFLKKMAHKLEALKHSHQTFVEVSRQCEGYEVAGQTSEVLVEPAHLRESTPTLAPPSPSQSLSSSNNKRSGPSTAPTSPNSMSKSLRSIPQGSSLFHDANSQVKLKTRKVFDIATKIIGNTLDLSLVYLLAVSPMGGPEGKGRTFVLSGYNLPSPIPVFDAQLHLRSLGAPEGGLLYQNPSAKDAQDESLNPRSASESAPYASAMLVRVGDDSTIDNGGFVLAGFTSDPKRVFGGEDVTYMKQFSQELARYTANLQI